MARHQQDEPSFGRTALLAGGIAASCLAIVITFVLVVGASSSAPSKSREPLGFEATQAARSTAASSSSGRASSSARATSSAHPSSSATSTAAGRTSAQASRSPRTSSAAPAPSTHSRSSSSSRASSPSPTPTPTAHLTFTVPDHTMTGSITISMPSGWTITGWHGGSRNGNTWTVVLSQVTLNVAGPSGSNETMTATIKPALGKTSTRTYTLS